MTPTTSLLDLARLAFHVVFVNLLAIAILSILASELLASPLRPMRRWLERRCWTHTLYFFDCDLCKGFWIILAICFTNYQDRGLPFALICYGLLVVYLSWKEVRYNAE